MKTITLIEHLFRYGDWAHDRLFALCDGLSDEQLDQPREMGFGSLRATLFHIYAAEQIWYERWTGVPWRPFPFDPQGTPLSAIADGLRDVARQRTTLIDAERESDWQRIVSYKDSKQVDYQLPLGELLLHVGNHGIHHRAQALHFLKSFGRTVPGGLDYLFFRLAQPTVAQDDSVNESLRGFGLEVNTTAGVGVEFERDRQKRYFEYSDWANTIVIELADKLSNEQLDHDFGMGVGSIRKTLLHMFDAEAWWANAWETGPSAMEHLPVETTIAELRDRWHDLIGRRNRFLSGLDQSGADRIITVIVGEMHCRFQVFESTIQLCGHGTHHRAQLVNMLRRSGAAVRNIDYLYFLA
ncbi:MAG: DinB family protein [Pirellulaceae bacterium]|nr:DinB family protein [Planctomycetales bacterium]